MGFFSKGPQVNKIYPTNEAMKIIKNYPGYTTIPVGVNEFKIVKEDIARKGIDDHKKGFMNRINGNGECKQLGKTCGIVNTLTSLKTREDNGR